MRIITIWYVALYFSFSLLPAAFAGADELPPKIGLTLSGGGAKGAAHIGVLEVLEEYRIPIHAVTGTSMGAYVGGMVALGLSAEEIKRRTFDINWSDGYFDRQTRKELQLREKKRTDEFHFYTDIGLSLDGEVKPFPGLVLGQKMASILRKATGNPPNYDSFDQLAIPYRAVATDLETIEPVVLDKGNLVQAMQASMSVPGALRPVHIDGRLLVDGGIVNNMPVDQVKILGADVVIAVDLRDQMFNIEDLHSAVTVVSQLTTHMTNKGTDEQIALLNLEKDIYIVPDVSFMVATDFDLMYQAYRSGRKAAIAVLPQLMRYQLNENEYARYRGKKRSHRWNPPTYSFTKITIINQTALSDHSLYQWLALQPNQEYSAEEIELAIDRLYAKGIFEKITYELEKNGKQLSIIVVEKSWGPGYLNLKVSIERDNEDRPNYGVGAEYTLTNITNLGGEWKSKVLLGVQDMLVSELYLPLDYQQQYFTSVGAGWQKVIRAFHNVDRFNLAPDEVKYKSWNIFTELGWNIHRDSSLAIGFDASYSDIQGELSSAPKQEVESYSGFGEFNYDNLDSFFFPNTGNLFDVQLGYRYSNSELDSGDISESVPYLDTQLIKPLSFGDHTLITGLKVSGSESNAFYPVAPQSLGGLFNLSGFTHFHFTGNYSAIGTLIYRYHLTDVDFKLFSAPLYLGGSAERGGVWLDEDDISWDSSITAGSLYIALDTLLGPVVLAYGKSEDDNGSLYFAFGSQ
jgi:NTE family protein